MKKVGLTEVLLASTLTIGGYVGITVFNLKTEVAIIGYKVDENHNMIKPMWEKFLATNATFSQFGD
tara:strand:+ start:4871 stop:5068 length:198 start_codon:yes stop_codon:yes gene_type:complete